MIVIVIVSGSSGGSSNSILNFTINIVKVIVFIHGIENRNCQSVSSMMLWWFRLAQDMAGRDMR